MLVYCDLEGMSVWGAFVHACAWMCVGVRVLIAVAYPSTCVRVWCKQRNTHKCY